MDNKDRILEYLRKHTLTVVASCFKDQPRAAVIDFSETENLEIIFTTMQYYRKYEDLLDNPKVAFAFGAQGEPTVQYEGIARELTREEFKPYQDYHVSKNPVEAKFAAMDEARFFKVVPTWIRYADYGAKPNDIFEITF